MLSKLSEIGLSKEAIYRLSADNHKEYLQRKGEKSKNLREARNEKYTKEQKQNES